MARMSFKEQVLRVREDAIIASVKEAAASGRIPKGRIEQSVERIARLKSRV